MTSKRRAVQHALTSIDEVAEYGAQKVRFHDDQNAPQGHELTVRCVGQLTRRSDEAPGAVLSSTGHGEQVLLCALPHRLQESLGFSFNINAS